MKIELAYSDDGDEEIHEDVDLALWGNGAGAAPTVLEIHAATSPGSQDKLNEDSFAAVSSETVLFAAVFDGVTSLRPIPALGSKTGARFASQFLKNDFRHCSPDDTPAEVLRRLNNRLRAASLSIGGTLADVHTLPASTATIVKIDAVAQELSFANIADSALIAYRTYQNSELLTHDTNKPFDAAIFDLIEDIARKRSITRREARQDPRINDALSERFTKYNNHPDGIGVGSVNGDPNMNRYIQTGTISLRGLEAVILNTDGLIPPGWSVDVEDDRQNLLTRVFFDGFQSFLGTKRATEDADPDWNFTRYKHSDDATGMLILL